MKAAFRAVPRFVARIEALGGGESARRPGTCDLDRLWYAATIEKRAFEILKRATWRDQELIGEVDSLILVARATVNGQLDPWEYPSLSVRDTVECFGRSIVEDAVRRFQEAVA